MNQSSSVTSAGILLYRIRCSIRNITLTEETTARFRPARRYRSCSNLSYNYCNNKTNLNNMQQSHPHFSTAAQQQQHQTFPYDRSSLSTRTSSSMFAGTCPSFITSQPVVVVSSSSASTTPKLTRIASVPVQQQLPQQVPSTTTPTISVSTAVAAISASQQQQSHSTNVAIEKVAMSDLRALFIASSIPMIGFGFMDQFVLIQAGGYIDATFGISFGLATLSAAAAGQVVSDVSGVVFGGALERFLTTNTSWLQTPKISSIQRRLPICRNVAMAGAIVGVIIGCAIGAASLLFVDLEARNRIERAQRLREIIQDMISIPTSSTSVQQHSIDEGNSTKDPDDTNFSCKSCTVYVVSSKDLTLPKDHDSAANSEWKVQLKDISNTKGINNNNNGSHIIDDKDIMAVQQCISSRSIVLSDDRRVMYAPVIKKKSATTGTKTKDTSNDNDDIMAIVAFHYGDDIDNNNNDHDTDNDNNTTGYYIDEDVVTARVMARHIAIFMDR